MVDETEVLYRNPLAQPEDVAGFRLEGEGSATFPCGRMRLESTRSAGDGQAANLVLWCPVELTGDLEISWSFWPVHEPGLCILFVHARGRDGRDLFDPGLADRFGPYEQYHSGDIDAYHLSYFRRRWQSERRFHTCNLRKSYGFHLVAQGADPRPSVLDADGPYRLRLTVKVIAPRRRRRSTAAPEIGVFTRIVLPLSEPILCCRCPSRSWPRSRYSMRSPSGTISCRHCSRSTTRASGPCRCSCGR